MYKKLTILVFSAVLFSSAYSMTSMSNAVFGDPSLKKCLKNGTSEPKCKKFAARVKAHMDKGWTRDKAEAEVAKKMGD